MKLLNEFFATARERYQIRERRIEGYPQENWTRDPVFQQWRFCNVFREHDRTTEWFRVNVRDHVVGVDAVRATIIFRWFNRVEIGEIVKDLLLKNWDSGEARRRLRDVRPVVTGAYIIKGWDGYEKLEGVLRCIDEANVFISNWDDEGRYEKWISLETAWLDLQRMEYMGPFMAYEAVSDLRWTNVLRSATDINSWANPGPGAKRGLGWVHSGDSDQRPADLLGAMRALLEKSRDESLWPKEWPMWEMREVEHWLCEFDKYNRALRGDSLKRRYR